MYTRASKIALVWAVAFFSTLVVFNNVTDYDSNYQFVVHVLKMDTTFPDNRGMWRALDSPFVHHAMYGLIILIEAVSRSCAGWEAGVSSAPSMTPRVSTGPRASPSSG